MKKSTLLVFFVMVLLNIQAQDYLIDFAGSGAASEIDTVKVMNLTSGSSVTLLGGDLLHLTGSIGIPEKFSDNSMMQLFPNPTDGKAMLTFQAPVKGPVEISIFDLSGRILLKTGMMASAGSNNCQLSGIPTGFYSVVVTAKEYTYSLKLICNGRLQETGGKAAINSTRISSKGHLKSSSFTVEMSYSDGDILLFTGISGIYKTIVTDVPTASATIVIVFVPCTDGDDNNYSVVHIGSQTWMAENLKTTHYLNGDEIPVVSGDDAWNDMTEGALCWYNNDSSYIIPYGSLYNWFALKDTRDLCPSGWRSPEDDEWTNLVGILGGTGVAGGKMKSIGTAESGTGLWLEPNTGATNASGFTAQPAGYRYDNGAYTNLGAGGRWWSATQSSSNYGWFHYVEYDYAGISRGSLNKKFGYSVRCIKD
jgi:uncharacterized protein (TIGR02145 family)